MRTMLISDFAQIKRTLLSTLLIGAFVCVVITISTGMPMTGAVAVAAMIPYVVLYSLLGNDEAAGWARMRDTLPLTRRSIVLGRFVVALAVTASACVVAVGFSLIAGYLLTVVPIGGNAVPVDMSSDMATEMIPLTILGGVLGASMSLVLLAVTLPVIMRLGLSRTARVLPLMFVIFFCGSISFLPPLDESGLLEGVSNISMETLGLVVVGIALALFAASALLTCRLYESREF